MIDEKEQLHGVAISSLLLALSKDEKYLSLIIDEENSSEYTLKIKKNINKGLFKKNKEFLNIGLYVKLSKKRRTPWTYTFVKKHQEDVDNCFKKNNNLFIILVNSNDGICCLDYKEFRNILDYNHEESEGIRVSRKLKQSYRLSGRDGKLKYTIAPSSFPSKIIEYVNSAKL